LLHSVINGLTLFPCAFLYALLTNELSSKVTIVDLLKNAKSTLYLSDLSIIAVNLLVIGGILLNFASTHNVSYNLGKVGEKSKLKQVMVIIGVPLFISLFLVLYLNATASPLDMKAFLEILIIIVAYVELNSIEEAYREE
jgi:hypothetical protein